MAETDIKTIRIELPYVKIGPSEDPFEFETYGKVGLFIAERPNGEFNIVDAVGPGLGVGTFNLPPSFNSFISKLLARKEQEEKESEVLDALDSMENRLDSKFADVFDKVSELMKMKKESNFTFSSMLQDANVSMGEVREQNSQIRTMIEKLGEAKKNTPEGGYVTEKTLLDIISSVRK